MGTPTSPVTELERKRAMAMPAESIPLWQAFYRGNFELLAPNQVARAQSAGKKVFHIVVTNQQGRSGVFNDAEIADFCRYFVDNAALASLVSPGERSKILYPFIQNVETLMSDARALEAEQQKVKDAIDRNGHAQKMLEVKKKLEKEKDTIERLAHQLSVYTIVDKLLTEHGVALGVDNLSTEQAVTYLADMLKKLKTEGSAEFSSLLDAIPDDEEDKK